MTQITHQDELALKKFGFKVANHQKQQVFKQIRSNQTLRQQFQKIKKSLTTMLDQDNFLQIIRTSHQKISQIPQNHKDIHIRDDTYVIRAINPQQIHSLTQRAFFNSFSLQRIMLKNNQNQDVKKQIQIKQNQPKINQKQPPKQQIYDTEKSHCICGKNKQAEWIQCQNQGKCRGSSWYHLECSGIANPKALDLDNLQYICMYCKRKQGEEESHSDPNKRVKKN